MDYSASAPIETKVFDDMFEIDTENYRNTDTTKQIFDSEAKRIVENAKKQIFNLLDIDDYRMAFTCGAAESNNIALLGLVEYAKSIGKNHIITTAIEHEAMLKSLECIEQCGFDVDYITPNIDGYVSVKDVKSKITNETFLVSIMHANNETGVIQPVYEIGKILKSRGILFHIDAAQSCGKLVDEIKRTNYDLISISAHKMSGPYGIGALVVKKGDCFSYVTQVQKQQEEKKAVELPISLIAGFGRACEVAESEHAQNFKNAFNTKLSFIDILNNSKLKYLINGRINYALPNILNISLLGIDAKSFMHATKDIKSAYNGLTFDATDFDQNYVLKAMKVSEERIRSSVKISFNTSDNDYIEAFETFVRTVEDRFISKI